MIAGLPSHRLAGIELACGRGIDDGLSHLV